MRCNLDVSVFGRVQVEGLQHGVGRPVDIDRLAESDAVLRAARDHPAQTLKHFE